jgi:hypothetical protein
MYMVALAVGEGVVRDLLAVGEGVAESSWRISAVDSLCLSLLLLAVGPILANLCIELSKPVCFLSYARRITREVTMRRRTRVCNNANRQRVRAMTMQSIPLDCRAVQCLKSNPTPSLWARLGCISCSGRLAVRNEKEAMNIKQAQATFALRLSPVLSDFACDGFALTQVY